jgi:hypothetical protein
VKKGQTMADLVKGNFEPKKKVTVDRGWTAW